MSVGQPAKVNHHIIGKWSCTCRNGQDNTKLSGAVDSLEGRDEIQRDLDRLEKWAHVNFMRFHKVKYKALYLGWGNPQYHYRLGDEWMQPCREGLEDILMNEKLDMSQQCVLVAQKGNHILG
ncbi:cAMP-dependent protein kinase inhibitor alpha [Grus japonensis]|uniref:cAMP-dependent protein kinase inhibitor alpha n=1 Tax=Grus japonensis TaxID=30415 RepID=A0ABC9Y245_GRUJA